MPVLATMVVEYVAETSGLAKGVLQVAELATVAALAVTAASVKMAGDFEKGMTALQTGAGESAKNLQMVSDGIKQIAIDTGTSTKDLLSPYALLKRAWHLLWDYLRMIPCEKRRKEHSLASQHMNKR